MKSWFFCLLGLLPAVTAGIETHVAETSVELVVDAPPRPGSSTQPALEGTPQGSVHGRVSWDGRITPCKRAPMNLSDLRQPLLQLAGLLLLPVGSRSSRVLPARTDTPRPPRAVLWEYRCSVYLPLSLRFSSHGRFILRHVVAPILPIP